MPIGLDDRVARSYLAKVLPTLNHVSALVSVLIIDIVLAGDNAIVVGMAASGLPAENRRRIIALGIAAAMVLRILFAFLAIGLLQSIIGMTLAGGLLLMWVCWKMYREILAHSHETAPELCDQSSRSCAPVSGKSQCQAMLQIVIADLSMSLDNVLAIAGVARDHPYVLVLGLVLSVALMGIASTYIARLLTRHFWVSWVGLGIITFVALRMVWDGSAQIFHTAVAAGL